VRILLECGYVGCCDQPPHRHATAHANATGHAIIRSLEPGEEWAWCCGDRMGMLTTGGDRSTVIPPSPLHRDPRSADVAALLSGSVVRFDLDPASAPAMRG